MKIYWYEHLQDYVFCYGLKHFNFPRSFIVEERYWALSKTGEIWYAQYYSESMELVAEVED